MTARNQRLGRAGLGDVTPRTGADRLHGKAGILVHGEDEDPCRLVPLSDPPDGLDAADAGHGEVHDDEVGRLGFVETIGLLTIGCLGDDAQAWLLLEHRAVALADDGMVVHQQNGGVGRAHAACSSACRSAAASGMNTRSAEP
ncbi:hypothetical protein ACVIM7_007469 [Bradyrhizobium liaoningense]